MSHSEILVERGNPNPLCIRYVHTYMYVHTFIFTRFLLFHVDSYRDGYLLLGSTKTAVRPRHDGAAMVPNVLFYDNQQVCIIIYWDRYVYTYVHTHTHTHTHTN